MSGGDVLDTIRSRCAEVSARATRVQIDDARVEDLVAGLVAGPAPSPEPDPARHHLGAPEATLAFVITLDAINFGSGYFPHLAKEPGRSGYLTVADRLKRHFERDGPFAAEDLASVSAHDCAAILGQDLRVPEVAELMGLFAAALRELGAFLEEGFGGRFAGPVEAAGGSAARLVEIFSAMGAWRDVSLYEELEVPFYKRAQITAADLAAAFGNEGPGAFHDLDRLTLFADNLVPHVLRCEGVLVYEPKLARRIDAGELVAAGSPEEVEIRAAAVHVVEGCVAELRRRGVAINASELDSILWNRGQRREFKARPRHRTRTTFY